MRRASKDISRALTPAVWKGAAWSTKQCRKALQRIASSPHAAVSVSQLVEHLGGGDDGLLSLESMNEQNLLLRRSFADDARDIDAAAFGPFRDEEVYMLPSAAHVLAARRRFKGAQIGCILS